MCVMGMRGRGGKVGVDSECPGAGAGAGVIRTEAAGACLSGKGKALGDEGMKAEVVGRCAEREVVDEKAGGKSGGVGVDGGGGDGGVGSRRMRTRTKSGP